MAPPSIFSLVGQHPILVILASYLSTIDLLHLSLTSRLSHALIGHSPQFFDVLKRQCLCDGRGLRRFLELHLKRNPIVYHDEEVEVRLFARKCDEANALPCRRCGINVCEECRVYPRTVPYAGSIGHSLRPHLSRSGCLWNIMCLCPGCDAAMEDQLRGRFLNARCDCDRYRRWICRKCSAAEQREVSDYYEHHTLGEASNTEWHEDYDWDEISETTKMLRDHGFDLLFFCTCGSTVPQATVPRCIWCKRRHRPEAEWRDEAAELGETMPPYADNRGCLPSYSPRLYVQGTAWEGYPRLGYQGPIYGSTDETSGHSSEGSGKTAATTLTLRSTQRVQGPMKVRDWQSHNWAGGWPI